MNKELSNKMIEAQYKRLLKEIKEYSYKYGEKPVIKKCNIMVSDDSFVNMIDKNIQFEV